MTLNTIMFKIIIYVPLAPPSHNFNPFCSTTRFFSSFFFAFWVTDHFVTCAANYPLPTKTLSTTRSKESCIVSCVYMFCYYSHILLCSLRLAISRIIAVFHFPIGHNVKFQYFLKNKLEINTFQVITFVWTVRGKTYKTLIEKES